MENYVSAQLLLFGQSILLGALLGVLYDLLRAFRLRLPRLTGPLDSLYCLLCAGTVFFFTLYRAQGQLRLFVLAGLAGGVVLFFSLCSAPLRPIWDFWVDTLAFLLHLMSFPLFWAKNFCEKTWNTEKISFILQGNAIQ